MDLVVEWRLLIRPMVVFLAILLLSVSALAGSYYFKAEQQQENARHYQKLREVEKRYSITAQDIEQIYEYYPRFLALKRQGLISRGNRKLEWVKTLAEVAERVKLPKIYYNLDSPIRYNPSWAPYHGRFNLMAYRMKLDMDLLHEIDLMDLLRGFKQRAKGWFVVDQCVLVQRHKEIVISPEESNLSAGCQLSWLTIESLDD